MSKYHKLSEFLANFESGNVWRAKFDDVEAVLGFPLPYSARHYFAWWANQNKGQSSAWQSAGWKATEVDIENERLTFVYVAGPESEEEFETTPLSIAEAKAGLAATFDVSPSAIEITIRA